MGAAEVGTIGRFNPNAVRLGNNLGFWPDPSPQAMVQIIPDFFSVFGAGNTTSVGEVGFSVPGTRAIQVEDTYFMRISGCFDSQYNNYLISMHCEVSTGAYLYWGLTSGFTDSYAGYGYQYAQYTGSSVAANRFTSQTAILAHYLDSPHLTSQVIFYIYGPALAQETAARSLAISSYSSGYGLEVASSHGTASAYDGFWIATDAISKTFSGTVSVYGMVN